MKNNARTAKGKRFLHKDAVVGHVFAAPFIFGFICFSLIPIVTSFYYAFTDYSMEQKQSPGLVGKILDSF